MKITFHLSQLSNIAKDVWQHYNQKKIWAFNAPMGAGKTTFIHSLCNVLGVQDTVSSPTFAIINEYKSNMAGVIYHMDWYRLKNENEAIQAGCEDCIISGNVCLIEWAENAKRLLPPDTLHINFEINNKDERTISIST